jgi:hypothetical protein
VLANLPPLPIAAAWFALLLRVEQPTEFSAIAAMVMLAALFGYANMLAFLKRGITFSILMNHARPAHSRRPDRDFINLAERVSEMRSHGWIEGDDNGWRLAESGRRVLRVRRLLLRALGIEAVG